MGLRASATGRQGPPTGDADPRMVNCDEHAEPERMSAAALPEAAYSTSSERVLTPGESVECVPLALYWVVAPSVASEVMLRLSRDAAGKDLLPTTEDEREAARAEREAARAEREAALHRVRILEEELRRRG